MNINIPLTVSTDADIGLTVNGGSGLIPMSMDTEIRAAIMPHSSGEVDITPGDGVTVLATAGKVLDSDIVIEAVPGQYGHIAWNGSALSVF